jgi:hypothetical protein
LPLSSLDFTIDGADLFSLAYLAREFFIPWNVVLSEPQTARRLLGSVMTAMSKMPPMKISWIGI